MARHGFSARCIPLYPQRLYRWIHLVGDLVDQLAMGIRHVYHHRAGLHGTGVGGALLGAKEG